MENRGYSIYEIGILGGNDKGEIKFILFLMFFNSDDLRRDELYLVEKDKHGKARLYSLSEFRNLRVDADYEKRYLTGKFGAIPYEDK